MCDDRTSRIATVFTSRYISSILAVFVLAGGIFASSPEWMAFFPGGGAHFHLSANAYAQTLSSVAVNKYESGLAALKRGDCVGAKALFKEAVALDPKDRTQRVGMFATDYFPNAKLKEAEAKCPSNVAVTKVESPPTTTTSTTTVQTTTTTRPATTTRPVTTTTTTTVPPPPAQPPAPAQATGKTVVTKVQETGTPARGPAAPTKTEVSPPQEAAKPKTVFINHKVYAGETWESIAGWYAGDAGKGKQIASANPNLSSKLKKGDVVKIPQELATVHGRQPNRSTAPQEVKPVAKTETPALAPAAAPATTIPPEAQAPKPPPPRIEGLHGVFGPK